MVLRLVDKDGEILKVACKQCITGHRAKDCDHGDRILIQTRPPGRPQMCPNCPTKAKYGGKRDPDCPKCSRYEWRYYVPGHGAPHRSRRTSKVKEPKPKIEEEKPLIIEDFRQYPNEAQAMIELGLEEPGTQDQDPAENTEGTTHTTAQLLFWVFEWDVDASQRSIRASQQREYAGDDSPDV
ncbi:MAG: hypothetical protein M1831_006974 [Alyxoria varia]|nr:MAG: hypothetical protein M1831_006974 [Alyxoria varia]